MDVDRWQRLSEVFHAALALERDQRAAFLEDACGEDDALRRDVEALLAKNVRGSGVTEQPALAAAQLTSDADTTPLSRTLAGRRFGRYMIVDWVGAGGMGEVYSAYDDQLDRHIAIKVLPRSSFKDPAARARLIREARTASKLNHSNICTIYEVGEAHGQTYIAMELIEGEPLSARLKRQPLTSAEIVSCSLQLAEALTHAHERSVIHRDLKSANVIITRDGRVKILDFGLAKHMAAADLADMTTRIQATMTQPGMVAGTLAYMAPELLRGQPADARSDIWALGVVYYEMAAGYLPFAAMTPVDLMTAVLNSATPPLPENVPPPIADVVDKCLEKAPERRFQSAREVLSTLESSGVSSRRVYKGAPMLGARAITALLAIGFVLVIAVAAILDVGQIRERADRMFSNNVLAFAERDWLLLADFENQTTDSIFDKSLDTALSVGIGQSSYVNVVPASRIESALRRMKLSEATAVDSTTAREIAQREGVKLILAPSIAEVGGVYQLSGSLQDSATGAVLKSRVVRVRRKEDVLNGLDDMIRGIRDDLGEAASAVSRQGRPLAEVTTSSLEALKVFSVAREVYTSARIDEAVTLFEEALRLDPSFAGARAQLGMIHFQLRDRKKGTELLAQTIQSVNELTEKERYGLLAFHAMAVENNPQKAADYYKTLLALYPDTWAPYNNLGRAYMQMGRWNEAVDALTRALRIEPDVMLTYNSLSEIYLYYLGDPNAAAALCRQQITYNNAHGLAYDRLGWALLGIGDFAQAREAFQKALVIDPHATLDLFRLGHTYRLERRYKDAYETFLRIPAIKPSPDSARFTTQRAAHYDAGVAAHLMGDARTAQSHFATYRQLVEKEIRENRQNGGLYLELAAVLSRLGEDAEATSAAARGMTLTPDSHFQYATVLSLQRKYSEAIDRLQLAIDGGFRNFVWMKIHPDLEPLAYEPRFQAILAARMKS